MKALYLTLMIFLQVLLASFIFYTSLSEALPVLDQTKSAEATVIRQEQAPVKGVEESPVVKSHSAVKSAQQTIRKEETKTAIHQQAPARKEETKTVSHQQASERKEDTKSPVQQQTTRDEHVKSPSQQHQVARKEETKTVSHQQAPDRKEDTKSPAQQQQQQVTREEQVKGPMQQHHQQAARKEETKQQQQQQVVRGEHVKSSAQQQQQAAEHRKSPVEQHAARKETAIPQAYYDSDRKLEPEPIPVPQALKAELEVASVPQEPAAVVQPVVTAPIVESVIDLKSAAELEAKQMGGRPYGNGGYGNGGYGNGGYGNGGYGNGGYGNGGNQVIVVPPGQQVTVISTNSNNGGGYGGNQPYRPYREGTAMPMAAAETVKSEGQQSPMVKGGLGPLHLLAASLCGYQADKPGVPDETVSLLYSRRAGLRKSLFDFMSLKFTNLERFSSRLNSGIALEVVPPKIVEPSSVVAATAAVPSQPTHGWPVVGACTAHDLKLMAEAAWCDCADEATCNVKATPATASVSLDEQDPKVTSNQHARSNAPLRVAREVGSPAPEADKTAIISKLLHVADVKEAPVVESAIASLNLTQQQLAAVRAASIGVDMARECRKNALRMTKALFNHLAEDQRVESASWNKLYAQMSSDECARKRMIDIVTALSGYRSEASSIRRDNVEFAFAMDDLRTKVLESDLAAPLTFDKQFIEVGQFLQQSVKLMLSNIDPDRARLTQMRYRSLMPGPVSADDQCIELHQRLLAKNYPTDCNPTQFGQLPDVLRMAASSLELWSIEIELAKQTSKQERNKPEHQQSQPLAYGFDSKHEVNECIANLVSY